MPLTIEAPLTLAAQFARLASKFGITGDELAKATGVDRAEISEGRGAAEIQSRLAEFELVIERLVEWAGGAQAAIDWYRSHRIPAFGGKTAETLVKSGSAKFLNDYLDHIAIGGFA